MKSTIEIIAEAKKQSPMKARRTGDGQEYYSYYEFPILAFDEFVRTLLESFGEEIITSFMEDLNYYTKDKPSCTKDSPCGCHFGETFHADGMCLCNIEEKQRLKVKEIISFIGK